MAYCCWIIFTILTVCFVCIVICIQKQYSAANLPSVFCTAHGCYIWYQNWISCTKFREELFSKKKKIEVHTDHQNEASGWWVEFEFVAKKSLLFWVKSDCASASTDPLLHANAIYAILSKTKKLWDTGSIVFNWVLDFCLEIIQYMIKNIQKSINTLYTMIRSYRLKLGHKSKISTMDAYFTCFGVNIIFFIPPAVMNSIKTSILSCSFICNRFEVSSLFLSIFLSICFSVHFHSLVIKEQNLTCCGLLAHLACNVKWGVTGFASKWRP